eukprot:4282223-Pyramimonas_sp.AAC.1
MVRTQAKRPARPENWPRAATGRSYSQGQGMEEEEEEEEEEASITSSSSPPLGLAVLGAMGHVQPQVPQRSARGIE